jgi:hypothetical protein
MDDKVAALSALLRADGRRCHESCGRRDRCGPDASFAAFLAAAFVEVVSRRFGGGAAEADVTEYVANVRGRSQEVRDAIDPRAAQRLILAALNDDAAQDVDCETRGKVFIIVIAALMSDERLDDGGIDAVLASARKLAGELQ